MYIPVKSVVTVCITPELSVITTSTPGIPGSPSSWTPLAFLSSNTVPLTLPDGGAIVEVMGNCVGLGVGDSVGLGVGAGVGLGVGKAVGLTVGEPVGDDVGAAVGL